MGISFITEAGAELTVMDLSPEEFARLSQGFDEAVDLPLPEREAAIERARREDGDKVAHELAALLKTSDQPTDTMDHPWVRLSGLSEGEDPPAFRKGELILGRFLIVRMLGRGGMGEVYEAQDRELGQVALKTIRRDLLGDGAVLRRFKREVQLARQVTSPYVCRIHELFILPDNGEHTAGAFLTMELLQGTTLGRRIEQGPLPWSEAEPIANELCQGLGAVHSVGLVHRDLKPGNVMLAKRGSVSQAVVMDLGLALRPEESLDSQSKLTVAGGIIGTPGYMAPEQFEGAKVSAATDIYALGLVLYEMTTGKRLFGASTPLAAAVRRGKRAPAVSSVQPGLPRHLDRVIEKCLEFEPGDRFGSAEEVAQALKGETAEGTPRAGLKTRRKLILAGAAGLALASAAAFDHAELESLVERIASPLPQKRFVAVLAWPVSSDRGIQDTLSGVIDAIESELARAEAFDSHFYVVASHGSSDKAAKLAQVVDPLGTNLVLATFGAMSNNRFELTLKLLDFTSGNVLRTKLVPIAGDQLAGLPARAVQAAASLLGVVAYVIPGNRLRPPATSPGAFKTFQAADALRKQPNDEGLEAAIEKYKEAIELDSHFATAYSRLAIAYCRLHALGRDPAALDLAEENGKAALNRDPNLVDGHLAMSYVLEHRGDQEAALAQISAALSLDPSNPATRMWQADLYTALNRLPEAESTCRLAIKGRPNYWLAHQDLGVVLDGQCKYREALKEFRAASLAAPMRVLPLTNVALVQSKLGMYMDAYESFHKSLALRPFAPTAFGLAQLLRVTGRPTDALGFAQQAVKLDPGEDRYWLELGDCYSEIGGHQPDASNAYRRALQEAQDKLKSSSDAATLMLLALYRLKAGVAGSPAETIAKAESMGPLDADSRLYKVRILDLTGQRNKALDALAACLEAGVTVFQVEFIPDLQSLRRDPRFTKSRPV
jgi:serine/threonine protein kinase/tetratricopeptide (TPR) repeat protein